ncbi:hypothetical protein ACNI3Q_05635 [Sphingomonas sp. FW199]|uniref:hypothetical protein n=1 Tax=Sphingomonas sp. FW199 TaxID=3400217 RepID=UPI003CEC5320
MVRFSRTPLILLGLSVAACVPRVDPPAPPPAPRPAPSPAPAPAPAPTPSSSADWRDWPVTPGDWQWRPGIATYGSAGAPPLVSAGCQSRQLTLGFRLPPGTASAEVQTSSMTAPVVLSPLPGQPGMVGFVRPANERLFDAIGFSRGRFVVTGGGQTLVIPAWPEFLRVVEDCRR